ncbi:MAG: leucine-rich repeat domain-containing protein [Oscillospiraceae bacterium]|nr:leucine-rich repeat domain-containing protein [Oscillospiraceae bacterium]
MSQKNRKFHISRLVAVALVVAMVLCQAGPVRADEILGGACGDNMSWTLSAGTLTVTGTGAMWDFPESEMAPWYGYRHEIFRLVLGDGISSVGDLAFYDCYNILAVTVPDSVTDIGSYAFAGCSGMEMLRLSRNLKTLGECAFSDCVKLQSLRLPEGLLSIGLKGFYRCESIPTVTVPASVTSIGVSAFGYCKSLVSADIQAQITTVPEFLFYGCGKLTTVSLANATEDISEFAFRGCDNLGTVYYDGDAKTAQEIQEIIDNDVPGFQDNGHVSDSTPTDSSTTTTVTENEDGTVTQENTTVTEGDNSSVSTTVESTREENAQTGGSYEAEIVVTVEGEEDWDDVTDTVEDALEDLNESAVVTGGDVEDVQITVYVTDSDSVDQEFLASMAGRDVIITVVTANGSQWRIDASQMDRTNLSGVYDLAYILTAADSTVTGELNADTAFSLRFLFPAVINAEVLIRLGDNWSYQNATLFQRLDGELIRRQDVVVDTKGYAHFYLASVDEQSEYFIAMNLEVENDDAIIPDELLAEYGENAVRYTPIQYQITGRTSSWGMDINQVTWIMVGVLGTTVVVVGFVMYMMNKRRLAMGYVPEIDEEDLYGYDDDEDEDE